MRHYSITRSRGTTALACLLCCLLWGVSAAWAGDGVVALQTADPSCADPTNSDRYIDCGNGTVTDNWTGLVWLQDANCIGSAGGGVGAPPGQVDWHTAMEFVAGLSDEPATSAAAAQDCSLSDGSSPGEWRLPSVGEWEAMMSPNVLACSPAITDDEGTGCWADPLVCFLSGRTCSFTGVVSTFYWSARTDVPFPTSAWAVFLANGAFSISNKASTYYVWPVRGGQ